MKKSVLLILAIPLLLAGCDFSTLPADQTIEEKQDKEEGETHQTTGDETHGSGSSTDDEEQTSGGGQSTTGGGQTTGGGESTTGGGQTTGGGTTGGGEGTQTQSTTIKKVMSEMGFTNQKDVTSFKMADDLDVTLSKGTNNQNTPKYYSSGESLRIYGGNTMTFACQNSKITKIVLQITADSGDNALTANVGTVSSDRTTWTGSANSITFTVGDKSGKICISTITVTYGGSGTGGDSGEGSGTGGETTGGGGGSGQSVGESTGNTSHAFTEAWSGIQKDITYSMFKGNLPCYKDFTSYKVGEIDGSTIPYFNPYVHGWSKDCQYEYNLALIEMGYTKVSEEPYIDENGNEDPSTIVYYYQKGTYHVQTMHYGTNADYYFDVYAYNEYQAPFKLDYTPAATFSLKTVSLKNNGYQTGSVNAGGITISGTALKRDSDSIQIQANSAIEIKGNSLSKMDITFYSNAYACLVYAGTSSLNAKIVYNDGSHYEFPSGTKYVKVLANAKYFVFDELCVK